MPRPPASTRPPSPTRPRPHLTGRGWGALLCGGSLTLAGALGAGVAATAPGILLLALVLLAGATTATTTVKVHARRRLSPGMVTVGEPATTELSLTPRGRWPRSPATVRDRWPREWGPATVARLPRTGSGTATLTRDVRPQARGHVRIGPASIEVTDAFGLVRRQQVVPPIATLVVAPRVAALTGLGQLRGSGWVDGTEDRASVSSGPDDSTIRPFRAGDDMRRVHWRATARHDSLMTRNEERVRHAHTTVLLDTRPPAEGAEGTREAGDPLEWLVEAAASIAVHLSRSGVRVQLLTTTGRRLGHGTGAQAADDLSILLDLSDVTVEPQPSTLTVPAALHSWTGANPHVLLLLGRLGETDVELLSLTDLPVGTPALLPPAATVAPGASARIHVVHAERGEPLAQTWRRLNELGQVLGAGR